MDLSDFVAQVTTPQILFFAVGMLAALVKSDLRIPNAMSTAMMLFLLTAIGLKGGIGLSKVRLSEALLPSLAAVALGIGIVLAGYSVLRRLRFDRANAGSIAGHYGAVSAVTMVMGFAYLDRVGAEYESFIPALYPFMDSFAIVTAIVLTRSALARARSDVLDADVNVLGILGDSVRGMSVLILVAALFIGYVSGEDGASEIMPFFGDMFRGILCLFMLDMGLVAAGRLHDWKAVGTRLVGYALLMPPAHGLAGVLLGTAAGLSVGGATMLGIFAASASYVSAPAAMRSAIPEANPSLSLTAAVALTFPMNVILRIPIYHAIAERFGASWLGSISVTGGRLRCRFSVGDAGLFEDVEGLWRRPHAPPASSRRQAAASRGKYGVARHASSLYASLTRLPSVVLRGQPPAPAL